MEANIWINLKGHQLSNTTKQNFLNDANHWKQFSKRFMPYMCVYIRVLDSIIPVFTVGL